MVESWAEHLRQHHRLSNADADIQRETAEFPIGPDPPVVRHFLALEAAADLGAAANLASQLQR